jgi:hypothetical protein
MRLSILRWYDPAQSKTDMKSIINFGPRAAVRGNQIEARR